MVASHMALLAILKTSQDDSDSGSGLRAMRQVSAARYVGSRFALRWLGQGAWRREWCLEEKARAWWGAGQSGTSDVLILKERDERALWCAGWVALMGRVVSLLWHRLAIEKARVNEKRGLVKRII